MAGRPTLRAACVAALCSVVVAGCGSSGDTTQESVDKGLAALQGVPQNGFTLGKADAPATLTIFAGATDLRLDTVLSDELPELVTQYVRPGKLKVQLRTLSKSPFETADDAAATAKLLLSAGLTSNAFWPTMVVLAAEYTGAWDESQALPLLQDAKVRNAGAVLRGRGNGRLRNAIKRADTQAAAAGVGSGPGYIVTMTDGARQDISRAVGADGLVKAVAAALR